MIADISRLVEKFGEPEVIEDTLVFNHGGEMGKLTIRSGGGENVLVLPEGGYRGSITVNFRSSKSTVFVATSRPRIEVMCGYGCTLTLLRGTTFTAAAKFILAEEKNTTVGERCMFARDVVVSNTDGHPIYALDGTRINWGKDISVGHHVWFGRGCDVMKGADIGSGAIVGARSVVTGKVAGHSAVGGIPAKEIRTDITYVGVTTIKNKIVPSLDGPAQVEEDFDAVNHPSVILAKSAYA